MPQAKYSSNLAGFNVIPIVISLDPVDDKFFLTSSLWLYRQSQSRRQKRKTIISDLKSLNGGIIWNLSSLTSNKCTKYGTCLYLDSFKVWIK